MIDLTPLEVRQKKGDFRRGMRGYDVELVNDFLDLVADRMEELVKQNMALRDRSGALETELTEYREKERALSEALMSAQKLREDARELAEREVDLVVREARSAADHARQEAMLKLAHEEESLRQVRARRAQLIESFRRLLERELAELAVIEETLELEAKREPSAGRVEDQVHSPAAPEPGIYETVGPVSEPPEDASTGMAAEPDTAPASEGDAGLQEDWLTSVIEERDAP